VAAKVKPEPSGIKDEGVLEKEFKHSGLLRIVAVIAIVAMAFLILAGLFAPGLGYSLVEPPAGPVDAPVFINELESLVDSKLTRNNSVEVIPNGENFYKAEVDAMRQAQHSINIEAYIFHRGQITRQVLDVLTDRAMNGVHVNIVMDSIGSFSTFGTFFRSLKAAEARCSSIIDCACTTGSAPTIVPIMKLPLWTALSLSSAVQGMPIGGPSAKETNRAGATPWFVCRVTRFARYREP